MTIETTYSQAREQLKSLMDRAVEDREVIVVRRRAGGDVAKIAADELESLVETAHLLRSPRNAERLLSALSRARSESLEPADLAALQKQVNSNARGGQVAVCHPEFLEDLQHCIETNRPAAKRLPELAGAILKGYRLKDPQPITISLAWHPAASPCDGPDSPGRIHTAGASPQKASPSAAG